MPERKLNDNVLKPVAASLRAKMVYCNIWDVCIRDGVNCLPVTAEEAKRLAEVIGSQGLHLRILKQHYFIKIFFVS